MQGLTQEQVQDLIYIGAFYYYEALLRKKSLINDRSLTIKGVVPYATWEIHMLACFAKLDWNELTPKLRGIKSATWEELRTKAT